MPIYSKYNAIMKCDKVHLIYFSPTHTSAKIASAIAGVVGKGNVLVSDLTCSAPAEISVKNTLTILAAPVYGGRVAETAMERFACIKASGSPVINVVLYGNRDYEDALLELTDYSVKLGFTPIAAGAFIGEHSYSREKMPIGANRPDDSDISEAMAFAEKLMDKLSAYSSLSELPALKVKGEFPYKVKGASIPAAPITVEGLCVQCGHCIEICPTETMSMDDDGCVVSSKEACIKCCACVKECSQKARIFDTLYTAMLFNNFKARREPELFF